MSISPVCTVNSLATPQNVAAGAGFTIQLAVPTGVNFWSVTCTSTDDTNTVAAVQATLAVNLGTKTATCTAPAGLGSSMIFASTVGIAGLGIDQNRTLQPSFTTTFKVNVLTSGGATVVATNEQLEQDPIHGWTAALNGAIRAEGSGGGSSQGTIALSNGLNSNVAITSKTSIRFGSYTAAVILGGLNITPAPTAGVPFDVSFTVPGQQVTIRHLDASSSAGNRIYCPSQSDVILPLGQAPQIRLILDATLGYYVLQNVGVTQRRGAHVSDFGAKGDSVTDDAPFIQAAINANPGGDIYIPVPPSGGYKVDSEITLSVQGTRVICEGRGGSSCLFLPGAPMRSVFNVQASDCELKGVFVYDTARNATYHFLENGDAGSVYDSCWAYYAKLDGFHAAQIRNAGVSAVTQTGSGSGPIPTVTLYASPSEGLPYQIKCTTGGTISGGGVAFTIEANGDAGTLVGPFTVPADGYIQFPHFVGYGCGNGMLVQFPTSGVYAASPQDAFSWSITGPDCLNDVTIRRECVAVACGQIYGTPAFFGSNHYIDYPANMQTSVSGCVLLTGGSQNVAGIGTSFFASGARSNDMIRVGTFPNWASSTNVPTGYLMSLGFIGSPQLTAPPGYAYIWEATTGGTTGASAPIFPTIAANAAGSGVGNSAPIGTTVVDGTVTWTCVCANVFQILRVAGNKSIVVQLHGEPGYAGSPTLPAYLTTGLGVVNHTAGSGPVPTLSGTPVAPHVVVITITGTGSGTSATFSYTLDGGAPVTGQTASAAYALGSTGVTIDFVAGTYTASSDAYSFQVGVDYALLVGSGYYEDASGNNNTGVFESCQWNENANVGMALRCDYGHKILGGQCTNNAGGAMAIGLDGEVIENLTVEHVYSEGNIVFGYWLAGVFGVDFTQCTIQDPNAHLMIPGDFAAGTWHGDVIGGSQSFITASGLGETYSTVPATQSAIGQIFTLNGPSVKTSGIVSPVAATPIDVSVVTGVAKAIIKLTAGGPTTMTATPLLANGVEGQEVVLLNVGNYPITFTGNTYPTAIMFDSESITLGIGDSVELRCIVNVQGYPTTWYQTGPVVHGVCVNGGQTVAITLANGMNSAVAIKGRKHLEISGPTLAFQISGFVPFASGDLGLGSGENGIPLELLYFGTQVMTIKHNDSSDETTASNRIMCPGAVDLSIPAPASGSFTRVALSYNVSQSRWIVLDYSNATGGHGAFIKRTTLTSGTSFTTQLATTTLVLRGVGGGAGGGGCTSVAASAGAAGGGGAGGYLEKTVTVAGNTAYAYTIGTAGAGVSASAGGNGGNSTFVVGATTYTAKGGTLAVRAEPYRRTET
jgi:Pectate lyase superfamily protein